MVKSNENSLNNLITDDQIRELKRQCEMANTSLFSYIELVRKTLDFIDQNKQKVQDINDE